MKTIFKFIVVFISFFCCNNVLALSNIKVDDELLSPYFDYNTKEYNYYTYSDKIVITVDKDEFEEVSGYGVFELIDGENIFEIISTKENITNEYKIHVFKNYKKSDVKSSFLKELSISGYDIKFNKNTYTYDINIDKENELYIHYETEEENAKVVVTGNSNLNSEVNEILIKVISSNKEETTYKINAYKTIEVFKEIKSRNETYSLSSNQKKIVITCIIIISYIFLSGVFKLLFLKKNSLNILPRILQK